MKQFGLQKQDIQKINAIFEQFETVLEVILYGSRAKGNFKNGSDIDLTIIDNNLNFSQLIDIESKLDDLLLPYKIDLSQKKHITNNDLIKHIEKIGKIFYKKNTVS